MIYGFPSTLILNTFSSKLGRFAIFTVNKLYSYKKWEYTIIII